MIERSQINEALCYTLRKEEHLRSSHRSQCFSTRDSTVPSYWSIWNVWGMWEVSSYPNDWGTRLPFSMRGQGCWTSAIHRIVIHYTVLPRPLLLASFLRYATGRPFPLCQSPVMASGSLLPQILGLEGTSQGVHSLVIFSTTIHCPAVETWVTHNRMDCDYPTDKLAQHSQANSF